MTAEPRTIDEQYASAVTTSDLTLRAHAQGAADVIIAAGLSERLVGRAIHRLRSEHDSANGTGRELAALKSWPLVARIVAARLESWGIDQPDAMAKKVTARWLNETCPACNGTKWQTVKGSNRHSAKACKTCHGTGTAPIPCGEDGRRLANWLDRCLNQYVASLRHTLGRMVSSKQGAIDTQRKAL